MHKIIKEDLDYILNSNLAWEKFKNATILISGANGFLPSYLVETFLYLNDKQNRNTKVIALVRNKEKALSIFSHHKNRADLEFIVQDVCKPIKLEQNVDFIIHAASQASPKYYGSDPVGTMNANILGTNNLLELAKEKQVKSFLFFSSGEVYGEVNDSLIPTKETYYGYVNPLSVRSCYAESKKAGETLCVSWHHQYNIPAKIVRPFHTYGPGISLDDGRVFADFIADIVHNRNIIMKSDGSSTRAFCYIADATIGFLTVLLNGKNGEAYNVSIDKETSIMELAETIAGLFPEKGLKVIKDESLQSGTYVKSNLVRCCPDISKIKTLGWKPETTIDEGFKRTLLSFL
ncbi:MAG: NAD-dependent epimerase/dehydratase family protein [bacterium]